MQLSDKAFLFLFLPFVLAGYYFPPIYKRDKLKNLWLVLASLGFYAWADFGNTILFVFSIFINYLLGIWVSKHSKKTKGKRIVALACVFNLGSLALFKYTNGLLLSLSGVFGFEVPPFIQKLALPLGILFYTFKALSYIIDMYRAKAPVQRNIVKLSLYLTFFSCAISGPIVKYHDMEPQFDNRKSTISSFSVGVQRYMIGLAKYIILGTTLNKLARHAFSYQGGQMSVLLAWVGAIAYALYIFYDFSGYSDMAIGAAKMFGFNVNENFDYPYLSRSVSEYWRRWHITLGEWFQEYLYYPLTFGPTVKIRKLAGKKLNRKKAGIVATGFTIAVIWLCTGLWHNAKWTFLLWAFINFFCVYIDTYWKPKQYTAVTSMIGFSITFLITILTKVICNSSDIPAAFDYIASMFHLNGNALSCSSGVYYLSQYAFYLVIGLFFAFPILRTIKEKVSNRSVIAKNSWEMIQILVTFILFVISITFVFGGSYNPPLYANF